MKLKSKISCFLQDSRDCVELFGQVDTEHITFFRSNPQLFAVSSNKGEVLSICYHASASAMLMLGSCTLLGCLLGTVPTQRRVHAQLALVMAFIADVSDPHLYHVLTAVIERCWLATPVCPCVAPLIAFLTSFHARMSPCKVPDAGKV